MSTYQLTTKDRSRYKLGNLTQGFGKVRRADRQTCFGSWSTHLTAFDLLKSNMLAFTITVSNFFQIKKVLHAVYIVGVFSSMKKKKWNEKIKLCSHLFYFIIRTDNNYNTRKYTNFTKRIADPHH